MNRFEKFSLLFIAVVLLYAGILKPDKPGLSQSEPGLPVFSFTREIPDGMHNYRSAQPSLSELDRICASGLITRVIRMNGDGKDSGGMSIQTERQICEKYGLEFLHVNAHSSGAEEKIRELLSGGRNLIHCRHGYDRTGGMVGYYLRRMGYSTEEVIQHNQWDGYLERKGKRYEKYYKLIL